MPSQPKDIRAFRRSLIVAATAAIAPAQPPPIRSVRPDTPPAPGYEYTCDAFPHGLPQCDHSQNNVIGSVSGVRMRVTAADVLTAVLHIVE
jgi:hypothetical protein